ncbi:MAG: tRNA(Ile)-lysidine synthetase, partial [Methylocaldum sp.]|nr:tRNA(Ile)-lysidine synthetase [Methylocaldum sp.]
MSLCTETLDRILSRQPPASRYWIAYSGGLDSLVLLHLCAELKAKDPNLRFTAGHVHHGLQTAA